MIQLDLMWVVLGCIVIGGGAVGAVFWGFWWGFKEGSKYDLEKVYKAAYIEVVERLQQEKEDAELIECNRDCARRRTDNQLLKEKRLNVGCSEYKRELHAEKPILTLCEQCHARAACPDRNDTQETCVKFITETPEQVIAENNIEAAESVKRLGAECVGNLTDMGFTDKEINEIYWHSSGGVLYAIHSNHKPVKISDGKVEFLGPDEMLPVDFWKKVLVDGGNIKLSTSDGETREPESVNPHHDSTKKACEESIGMTDEARKILDEGDDDPLT